MIRHIVDDDDVVDDGVVDDGDASDDDDNEDDHGMMVTTMVNPWLSYKHNLYRESWDHFDRTAAWGRYIKTSVR